MLHKTIDVTPPIPHPPTSPPPPHPSVHLHLSLGVGAQRDTRDEDTFLLEGTDGRIAKQTLDGLQELQANCISHLLTFSEITRQQDMSKKSS